MGTRTDWIEVLFLTLLWTIGTLTWGYIRRRKQPAATRRTIPWNKLLGVYLMTLLLGFDFGVLARFGPRALHRDQLIALIGANVGLAIVVLGFRLLSPLKTS